MSKLHINIISHLCRNSFRKPTACFLAETVLTVLLLVSFGRFRGSKQQFSVKSRENVQLMLFKKIFYCCTALLLNGLLNY